MYILTQRAVIQGVAKRWAEQYPPSRYPDKQDTTKALQSLNLDECSKEAVNEAIGNSSWTRLCCDDCGKGVDSVVVFGGADYYGMPSASVCIKCLRKATKLFKDAK